MPGAPGSRFPMRKADSRDRNPLRRKRNWEARGLALPDAPAAGPEIGTDGTAARDPLTGAYNRSHLVERLNSACLNAIRRRSQFVVFVLGIERLAEINQKFGYDVADEAIVAVARRLGEN